MGRWSAIVVGVATATVLAACGDDGSEAPAPQATDYASCLQANGVTFQPGQQGGGGLPGGRPSGFPSGRPTGMPTGAPDDGPDGAPPSGRPGSGPGGFLGSQAPAGVDQATWEKAQKACEGLRPTSFPGGGNRGGDNGALMAYRNCLTDRGVTVPGSINDLDASDPKVTEAMAACAALRPSGGPAPSASQSS